MASLRIVDGKILQVGGELTTNADCCCEPVGVGGAVLIWYDDSESDFHTLLDSLIAIYTGLGIDVDTSDSWTNDIDDYGLIFWLTAKQDPSWWSAIEDGTWNGRIVITCEHNALGAFADTRAY